MEIECNLTYIFHKTVTFSALLFKMEHYK